MRRTILIVALAAIMLLTVPTVSGADNFLQNLVGFVGNPDGSSMMFLHGRTAQAIGPSINFQLVGPVYLDIGVLTSNTDTSVRVVPGISLGAKVSKASGNSIVQVIANSGLQVFAGVAWTPDSYGGTRIGNWELKNVGFYGGLRKTF